MSDSVSDNNSNGDYDSNYEENSVSNSVNAEEINSLDGNKNNESNKSKLKHGKLVKEAKRYKEKLEKRGVVYLSRVPPFMKPNKVRTLFEEYGEVTRLYLAEEDPILRKRRKEKGGNGSKQFSEGWIEFADKKIAKQVAESLNNTVIGGKKGGFYHDDIWNLKYLKGFKWDYLTEKFAYEKRVRENKLKMALMQAKRSNAEFIEQVEKKKVQDIISERKRKRSDADDSNSNNASEGYNGKALKKKFRQQQLLGTHYGEARNKADKKLLQAVASK